MGKIDCKDNEMFEKTLSEETVFTGRVFECEVRAVELSDGRVTGREIVKHTGGACILPVDDELNCHVVRQFRSGAGQVMTEVPAGKIEPGEDPLECVRREVREETGYDAGRIESLGFIFATPAYCSEKIHLFLGTELTYKGGRPDNGEFLCVEKIPLATLVTMCDEGKIFDAKSVACIYKAARRLLK